MRRCLVATLVTVLLTSGCVAGTYKPPYVPIKCVIGLRTVECKVDRSIVTQFGEFGVELDVFHTDRAYLNQRSDDVYILVIRHLGSSVVVDTVYQIPADRELTLAGDGPFLVEFGHRRAFADVSNGKVTLLELRDPNDPQSSLQLGVSPAPALVPGIQRTNSVPKPTGGMVQPPNSGGRTSPGTDVTANPPAQTTVPPARQLVDLGGFSGSRDLNAYCRSQGFKEAYVSGNWICRGSDTDDLEPHADLNMFAACVWAYPNKPSCRRPNLRWTIRVEVLRLLVIGATVPEVTVGDRPLLAARRTHLT